MNSYTAVITFMTMTATTKKTRAMFINDCQRQLLSETDIDVFLLRGGGRGISEL